MPGATFGLSTSIDNYFAKADKLAGSVICLKDKPIKVYYELKLKYNMLDDGIIKMNELLLINAWTSRTIGTVIKLKKTEIIVSLKIPIAIIPEQRVALSKRVKNRWKLSGWGEVI